MTDEYFDEDLGPSKTQRKKESNALQEFGEKLTALNDQQIATLNLDSDILDAVKQARIMRPGNGRRRQIQYIGKLLRNSDFESIQLNYDEMYKEQENQVQLHHVCENWRDRLIDDNSALQDFIDQYPQADRQQLRQLLRNIPSGDKTEKSVESTRKLYKHIKQIIIS
ncbi:ribosome biogenesis factor YjgA [Sessilibacter sp. MAH2]